MSSESKGTAYRTWLGYYKQYCGKIGWKSEQLVQMGNSFALDIMGTLVYLIDLNVKTT